MLYTQLDLSITVTKPECCICMAAASISIHISMGSSPAWRENIAPQPGLWGAVVCIVGSTLASDPQFHCVNPQHYHWYAATRFAIPGG